MGVKVVTTLWSQQLLPHSCCSSSSINVNFNKRLSSNDVVLSTRHLFIGTSKYRKSHRTTRACITTSAGFDEDFSRKIEELTLRFKTDETELNNVEMKAKCVDIPVSLRMIKQKNKKKEIMIVGENSMKKAFSSMVFIIKEIHSYTLQMRELLFYEDLKHILARVQCEIHASFVWLFQQVFSHTPTLLVYIMILLANFSVHSMSAVAVAAPTATSTPSAIVMAEVRERFDPTTVVVIKSFSHSDGAAAAVGEGSGGGTKSKPVASGMEADNNNNIVISDGVSVFGREIENETMIWNSIVEEASRMQSEVRDETLDHETLRKFVSPVTVKIDGDSDYEEFFRTDLFYQTGLGQEPTNVLLLANYAQFLFLVAQDYDRAEEYFKRAIKVEPKDGEAHNKYANFLWQVRKDLWAAEETYLEAISAEPTNSFYAANYAHFLWNTGGEDTCFPLDSPDDESLD